MKYIEEEYDRLCYYNCELEYAVDAYRLYSTDRAKLAEKLEDIANNLLNIAFHMTDYE